MISEFDVIRMLLDIQETPEKMPDNMMTKTKDTIIRENIRDLLKQAENVTKPEQNAQKPEQNAQKPEQNAQESASEAISSKDLVVPLLREKEAMKKLSGGAKPIFDKGKLQALRRAGWSVKAIADEMKCSEQTVRNHMKKEGIK